MYQINEFVDERQKAWCIQCRAGIGEVDTSRDHVPSKALLRKPYPDNLPVVNICVECNNGFSEDEEYLHLFLQCALFEYGEPMLGEPTRVWTLPLTAMSVSERDDFEYDGVVEELARSPEVGSRMMVRVFTGQDMRDGWVIVQDGVYRFRVQERSGIVVRSALCEYVATEVHWSDY